MSRARIWMPPGWVGMGWAAAEMRYRASEWAGAVCGVARCVTDDRPGLGGAPQLAERARRSFLKAIEAAGKLCST